jgi:tetrahydromethanopterin S-methyltransferase subunit B
MPYRHAHWWLLLLFPLTALAFWPNYFSDMRGAPYAFHVHGITASLWIALLAAQSWAIHTRRNGLHRTIGYWSFALFPFFIVGGVLVLQTMAVKFAAQSEPFSMAFGARLGAVDAISVLGSPLLFAAALRHRRKVHLHSRYMLATVFFLIAPILSRLLPILPPLAIAGPQDFGNFVTGAHIGLGFAALLALALALRAPRHGRPWLIVAGLVVAQSVAFETLGRTVAWEGLFVALASVPTPLLTGFGFAVAVGAIWAGWAAAPPLPPRRTAQA